MTDLFSAPWRALSLAGILASVAAGAAESSGLRALDEAFPIAGKVHENKDVSTVTWGETDLGIMASDEGSVVQILRRIPGGTGASILRDVPLARPADLEMDFEASAVLDGWFYLTGSHGAAKKKGTYSEERARIYRFRVSPDGSSVTDLQMASLAPVFEDQPTLVRHHRRPLQQRGLNVEGLAARNGHLYVGLRSPNLEGHALVLRVPAADLFAGKGAKSELLRIPVGAGLGIRAMAPARDGFLIILGNAGSEESKQQPHTVDFIEGRASELYSWNPDTGESRLLGVFPPRGKGKEEGIFVMSEDSDGTVELVVIYDSIKDGGFERFRYTPGG